MVLSNRPEAPGLAWAAGRGIANVALPHAPFGKDRQAHEAALDEALRAHAIEVVALAGYMRVLTPWLVGRWSGRMLNIHPSLLPKYPGLDTHRRALDAGDREAGCTVHLVSEGVDEGPILTQARVPVLSEGALAMLKLHQWPGNVRELENVMRRALLLGHGSESITPEHIVFDSPARLVTAPAPTSMEALAAETPRRLSSVVQISEARATTKSSS